MQLIAVILRSYRSFNFDYRAKFSCAEDQFATQLAPWDNEDTYASWRPWVTVPIVAPITCVVGLNEAGKSHLIDGIEKVLTDTAFRAEDICRYSPDSQIGSGGKCNVGLIWSQVPRAVLDAEALLPVPSAPAEGTAPLEPSKEQFGLAVLRRNDVFKLISLDNSAKKISNKDLDEKTSEAFLLKLPRLVRAKSAVKLPSKVGMGSLFKLALKGASAETVATFLKGAGKHYFPSAEEMDKANVDDGDQLVYSLLEQCANLNYEVLTELADASEQLLKEYSKQATENAEELLNLSHWWAQDVDAKISLDLRNREVVLNLTDRTGSWYGFPERSQGMRYFLGYIMQVLLEMKKDDRQLLILSDEPDFALSAVGQRDLLRFFKRIVAQERDGGASQLIFTTHSPEMIDPNYPNRVSILRKGLFDEGTIVVGRSHHRLFEPIRSALGARVTSFPFLDGPNIVVEGTSDQIFLVRASQYLAQQNEPHLDLAYLSIVVAEGTKRMPRIAAMAKAVNGDRAYATFLVDNDGPGRDAVTELGTADPYLQKHEQILSTGDVLEIGIGKDSELEDLVPATLYLTCFLASIGDAWPTDVLSAFTNESVVVPAERAPILDVIESIIDQLHAGGRAKGLSIDKHDIMERVFDALDAGKVAIAALDPFRSSMRKLTSLLLDRINENLRHKRHDEVRRSIQQVVREFCQAYAVGVSKARAVEAIGRIRDLGNRVSEVGRFDQQCDEVLAKFQLMKGLRSEHVGDLDQFFNAIRQLPQRLTVDQELKLM